jgi:hypothetical protein
LSAAESPTSVASTVMELSLNTLIVAEPDSVLPAGWGFSFAAARETVISLTTCAYATVSSFLQETRKVDKPREANNRNLVFMSQYFCLQQKLFN